MHDRARVWLFDARAARRDAARPGDGRARRSDLSDRGLRLRLDRAGGGAVRAAHLRPHLQPHQQSDGCRVRGTMASLEGGLGAVAFSSGLAAQLCTVLSLAQAGDHIVCTQNVYGGTVTQLSVTFKRMGIETTFVPVDDLDARTRGDRPKTQARLRRDDRQPVGHDRRHGGAMPSSRTAAACRWSSTTRSRRRICAGRSSTAPTSSSTRRRSSSADTARRSAA